MSVSTTTTLKKGFDPTNIPTDFDFTPGTSEETVQQRAIKPYTIKSMSDTEQETQIEDNLEEDDEDVIPSRFSISVSRIDFPIDGIVKRLRDGNIYIPSFQRSYVWKTKQASRFIESLLLGLPVPGIFLARERETKKLLVIDGQQRLCSLKYFYEGKFPHNRMPFSLKGVNPEFVGLKYKTMGEEYRRQLDNSILYATIVEDNSADYDSSIYHIFERLNTGGTLLKSHEIRACIYHGELNDLINNLNNTQSWRAIFGKPDKNMRDQELILRFLALYFNGENYNRTMREFLNKYMSENRHLTLQSEEKIILAFLPTVELINKSIGARSFKLKKVLNAAVFEGVMVGIARRLEKGEIENLEGLKERYEEFLKDENFLAVVSTRSTNKGEILRRRLILGTEAFADLE